MKGRGKERERRGEGKKGGVDMVGKELEREQAG